MNKFVFLLFFFFTTLFAEINSLTTLLTGKTRSISTNGQPQISIMLHQNVLQKNQPISIDLPDNISSTFKNSRFVHRNDGDFSWAGKPVNGAVNDYSLFTTKDGATYGVIVFNNAKYIMRKSNDGTYIISKETKVKPDEDDFLKLPPGKSLGNKPSTRSQISSNLKSNNLHVNSLRSAPLRSVSDVVNVMILYTQAFADYYGSGLNAKIQYSIDYANEAMQNSGIALTYNLAHQALYENAQSNETVTISNALYHISGTNDISINEQIRRLRAIHDIDITSLFRLNASISPGGEVIGVGWIPGNADRLDMRRASYNVSEYSDETFAHESGHNFGCGHSRDIDDCDGALFSYACGYDSESFGTIMSYNQTLGIPYFSNPDLHPEDTGGAVIGDVTTDCSRGIEETKTLMAMNDDITEVNEESDTINDNSISGEIAFQEDRDWYQVGMGGDTTFQMAHQYFYINLYDEDGFFIRSFGATDTITLDNGIYNVIISNSDDENGDYWIGTGSYGVNVTSNYVEPPISSMPNFLAPILNYLLF